MSTVNFKGDQLTELNAMFNMLAETKDAPPTATNAIKQLRRKTDKITRSPDGEVCFFKKGTNANYSLKKLRVKFEGCTKALEQIEAIEAKATELISPPRESKGAGESDSDSDYDHGAEATAIRRVTSHLPESDTDDPPAARRNKGAPAPSMSRGYSSLTSDLLRKTTDGLRAELEQVTLLLSETREMLASKVEAEPLTAKTIESLTAQVDSVTAENKNLEGKLAEIEAETAEKIKTLTTNLAEAEAASKSKDNTIAELQETIASQKADLARQGKTIAEKDKKLKASGDTVPREIAVALAAHIKQLEDSYSSGSTKKAFNVVASKVSWFGEGFTELNDDAREAMDDLLPKVASATVPDVGESESKEG